MRVRAAVFTIGLMAALCTLPPTFGVASAAERRHPRSSKGPATGRWRSNNSEAHWQK